MALIPSALELALIGIFTEMNNSETPMTDAQYANKLAIAITNQIKTAQVTTSVNTVVTGLAGTIPVTGTGIGSGTGSLL